MNIILDNAYTRHLHILGKELPQPNAILVISAHWLTDKTYVSSSPLPDTIYDFYGFPDELYKLSYPCKGSPELAQEIVTSLRHYEIKADEQYGLDHASWAVLKHIYPDADIPVIEMSLDIRKSFQYHFNLGKELGFLREKGILIIGSGNIVHNLRRIDFNDDALPFDWAKEADDIFKKLLTEKEFSKLIYPDSLGPSVKMAIPTAEHYIPMIYIIGLLSENDKLTFTHEGIQNGSISMRCFRVG
jgi:4,5-DOPA dioxygenase extradiol